MRWKMHQSDLLHLPYDRSRSRARDDDIFIESLRNAERLATQWRMQTGQQAGLRGEVNRCEGARFHEGDFRSIFGQFSSVVMIEAMKGGFQIHTSGSPSSVAMNTAATSPMLHVIKKLMNDFMFA